MMRQNKNRPSPFPGYMSEEVGLGQFEFFNFSSIQFGFQSQVLGFVFFWFWYSHTIAMQEYSSV